VKTVANASADGTLDGTEATYAMTPRLDDDWLAWSGEFGRSLEHQLAYSAAWRLGFEHETKRRRR
jgi:hypothetical protein